MFQKFLSNKSKVIILVMIITFNNPGHGSGQHCSILIPYTYSFQHSLSCQGTCYTTSKSLYQNKNNEGELMLQINDVEHNTECH